MGGKQGRHDLAQHAPAQELRDGLGVVRGAERYAREAGKATRAAKGLGEVGVGLGGGVKKEDALPQPPRTTLQLVHAPRAGGELGSLTSTQPSRRDLLYWTRHYCLGGAAQLFDEGYADLFRLTPRKPIPIPPRPTFPLRQWYLDKERLGRATPPRPPGLEWLTRLAELFQGLNLPHRRR